MQHSNQTPNDINKALDKIERDQEEQKNAMAPKKEMPKRFFNYDLQREDQQELLNRITVVRNASKEELLAYLTEGEEHQKYVHAFAKLYNLSGTMLNSYLQKNRTNLQPLSSATILEQFAAYQQTVKGLILTTAKEMAEIMKNGSEQSYDLYHYYETTGIHHLSIISYANELGLDNCAKVMQRFQSKKSRLFDGLTEHDMKVFEVAKRMTCDNTTIAFDSTIYNNARQDMEEKGMPFYRGVLFGAIKRQIAQKQMPIVKQKSS